VTDARKQLLAAVYAEPANDAPRAVYGDWLLEQGHPLGQFIQLQLARAGGKKGTKGKEERLLAEHGATFWPEHPASVERVPPWAATERGFPVAFSQPLPVIAEQRREVVAKWLVLAGNPAWATIRRVTLQADMEPALVERLLLDAPMPLLDEIESIGTEAFARIADTDLPVRRVQVEGPPFSLSAVRGLPQLRELELLFRTDVDAAMSALAATGLRDRLEVFELRACESARSFAQLALDVLGQLPENVARVSVDEYYGKRADARRGPSGVSLNVSLTFHDLERIVATLRDLQPSRVASVHVVFAEGGYFTKKNRAPSERRIEDATAHLRNVTYGWSTG
jgi:uncharacterized protein (TIGR02996 family)